MTNPGRFGDFLLLSRLSKDAVGERYRAAPAAGGALRDVVLLQLFTAPGTDGAAIASAVRAMPPDLEPILAPSIARDVGIVDGLPWARYAFRQSFGLRALLERANGGFSTLAIEHAALIAERLAKVLIAFHHGGIAHGFVVPELIAISNEGEVCLFGAEQGPALLAEAVARRMDRRILDYLSPEVRAGAVPDAADDLFTLGTLFFELLTGNALRADDPGEQLRTARSIATDEPLPDALRSLLASSLAPRAERISDAGEWHGLLAAWMGESGFAASNFDLAFLVHELFRDHLGATEATEAEPEVSAAPGDTPSTLSSPDPAPMQTPAPAPMPTPMVAPVAGSPTVPRTAGTEPFAAVRRTDSPKRLALIAVAAVAALAIALFGLQRFRGGAAPDGDTETVGTETVAVAGTAEGTEAAKATDAALGEESSGGQDTDGEAPDQDAATVAGTTQAELERLIAERTSAVGKRLADDYGTELGALEEEIEAARAGLSGSPPSLVSMPEPKWPGDAVPPGDGTIRVQVLVAEDGTVREARIPTDGLASGLAEAARSAALGARFAPATVDGAPAAQWTEVVVRFAG